jgi:tyrosyl-tRNA synthetase
MSSVRINVSLPEETLLAIFEGVPGSEIAESEIEGSLPIIEFLTEKTGIFPSKSEARRMFKEGGIQINKQKVDESFLITGDCLLNRK